MKITAKELFIGLILLGLSGIAFSDSTTSRWGLTKPDIGSTNWGPKINTNYDTIDDAAGVHLTNTFTSTNSFNTTTTFNGTECADGTASAPCYRFSNEPTTGFIRPASGQMSAIVAGSTVAVFNSGSGLVVPVSLAAYQNSTIGIGPVTGSTATATTGGSLSGAYFYKIWPYNGSIVGIPSPEMAITISGGNSATSLSWTAVAGASAYRVTRGTTSGGPDGYYQVTSTTYTDTGASFTSGSNPYPSTGPIWINSGGSIITPASGGGFGSYDWVTGAVNINIAQTSAGELQYQPGTTGSNKGVHFFQNATGGGLMEFDESGTHSEQVAWLGNSLNIFDETYGTALNLRPNNSTEYSFYASSAVFLGNLTLPNGTASVPAWRVSTDASGMYSSGAATLNMALGGVDYYNFLPGSMRPAADASQDVGGGSARFRDGYFTGTARLSGSSGQVIFGTTVTLNVATTGISRNVALPDVGGDSSIVLSTGTQTIGGTLVINSSTSYAGSTGGAVAQGNVGFQSSIAIARPGSPLTNNSAKNITTSQLTLQPGHYMLIAQAGFDVVTGTPASTQLSFAISVTSGTMPSISTTANPNSNGEITHQLYGPDLATGSSNDITGTAISYVRITSQTTFNLVAFVNYSAGQIDGYGSIQAIQLP